MRQLNYNNSQSNILDLIRSEILDCLLCETIEFEHLESYKWISSVNSDAQKTTIAFKLNIVFKANANTRHQFTCMCIEVVLTKDSMFNLSTCDSDQLHEFIEKVKNGCVDKLNLWKSQEISTQGKLKFSWMVKYLDRSFQDYDIFDNVSYEGAINKMRYRAMKYSQFVNNDGTFKVTPSSRYKYYQVNIQFEYSQDTLF